MNQNDQTNGNAAAPPGAERQFLVLIAIAVVAVMFVGMVALLYLHEKPAPSAIIVMRVPKVYDGAMATIDTAPDSRSDISTIHTRLIADKEVRISLPPGKYTVKIEHKGKLIPLPPNHQTVDVLELIEYSYFAVVVEDPAATQPARDASAAGSE